MKNLQKGSTAVILLIIVVVVLLGIIGYLYLRPAQSQVSETVTNQQNVNEPVQSTPKVSETKKTNNTSPVVNTAPELLTYSGKTDMGVSFSIKYPFSWTYYKFSCNADGIAFWPKNIAPDFSKGTGGSCSTNFIEGAPIIVYSTGQRPSISLNGTSYQAVYTQMKSSLTF